MGESLRALTHTEVRLLDLIAPEEEAADSRSTEQVANDIIDGMAAILGE